MYEVNKKQTELATIAEEIIKMFKPLGERMEFELVNEVPLNLPKIFVDSDKIKQVITNLISNALKFTPAGGKVTVVALDKDKDFIQAGVKDTGVGIPEDKLSTVFEKFQQVKEIQHRSEVKKGTG